MLLKPQSRIFLLITLAGIGTLVWNLRKSPTAPEPSTLQKSPSALQPAITSILASPPLPANSTPAATPILESENQVEPSPQQVFDAIDNLQFTFRDFAAALHSNPIGTNAEITASLLGENLKQIKFPIPEGSNHNDQGELCDAWNSPWFFHQLSGTQMEVRSAGPDRTLYTDDDFVR